MCQKRRLIYRVTLDDEKSGSLNLPSLISTWKGCFIKFIGKLQPIQETVIYGSKVMAMQHLSR